MKNVFHDCKVTVLGQFAAVQSSIVTFRAVDMAADGGYEGVAFAYGVQDGAAVAAYVPKVQQDTTSGFGTVADLAGSANTFASIIGAKTIVADIGRPSERWVRPLLTVPATNATTVVSCTAIQYNGRSKPATQDSTTIGSWTGEFHAAPAEGVA